MTRQANPNDTLLELKCFAIYQPDTGRFICKATGKGRTVKIGDELGHISKTTGYRYIIIHGQRFSCHALAHLWMTGKWHTHNIDHIDNNRANNQWSNLRVVTHRANSYNRKTPGGVGYHKASGKYRAYIVEFGAAKHLGLFSTIEEAKEAHKKARDKVVQANIKASNCVVSLCR